MSLRTIFQVKDELELGREKKKKRYIGSDSDSGCVFYSATVLLLLLLVCLLAPGRKIDLPTVRNERAASRHFVDIACFITLHFDGPVIIPCG